MDTATATTAVYLTGDLITPDEPCSTPEDCTCTFVYGDACEHGYGATLTSGWVDPSWSLWVIQDNREDVSPVISSWDIEQGAREGSSIRELVESFLGSIDSESDDTYYAADEIRDYASGASIRLAAHVVTV